MKNGIVIAGNVFVDIKGFPFDNYIPAGRNAGNVEIVHGGVGRNVAEDIANMELRPTFVSMVDDNAQGEEVIQKLRNHKVNTDYIVSAPDGMGIWLAIFDESGDVVGSISKRPVMDPMVELLDKKGDEIFSACDSVVLEIDMDKEVVKVLIQDDYNEANLVEQLEQLLMVPEKQRRLLDDLDSLKHRLGNAGASEIAAELIVDMVK